MSCIYRCLKKLFAKLLTCLLYNYNTVTPANDMLQITEWAMHSKQEVVDILMDKNTLPVYISLICLVSMFL